MRNKLRLVCPVGLLCLAVLVFCTVGLHFHAVAADTPSDVTDAAVTYNADPWLEGGVAGPAVAEETSAVHPETSDDLNSVPAQPHRDSGYTLTEEERMTVERIVMCEAGGEGERGQMMVAQCILDGMLRYDYSVYSYITNYQVMLTSYYNVTDEVRNSVSRVFDNGERVIEHKADLWYNPAITPSEWHEQQEYVITVGSHRFFWMIDNRDSE